MEKLKNTKISSQGRKSSGAGCKARDKGRRNEPGTRGEGWPFNVMPGWRRCFVRATPELAASKAPGSQASVCEGLRKDGKPMMGRQNCKGMSAHT